MSVDNAYASTRTFGALKLWLARVAVAAAATALVGLGLFLIAQAVFATGMLSGPAPRNPFGTGGLGHAPMATSSINGAILAVQAQFYAVLTAAVHTFKNEGMGLISLVTVGFLYGIFHAAGPGHGKGVIAGYVLASQSSWRQGLALSFAAALLQAIVAVLLVGTLAVALGATAATIDSAARGIEVVSFAAVAGMGLILLWSKSGEVVRLSAGMGPNLDAGDRGLEAVRSRHPRRNWHLLAGVIMAAGIRPCSGAIILLVFSLSQGVFFAGVAGAFAMAIGTWMTTGTLASLTVFAKSVTRRTTGAGVAGPIIFAGFETLAAAFVLTLGALLLAGTWTGGLVSVLD